MPLAWKNEFQSLFLVLMGFRESCYKSRLLTIWDSAAFLPLTQRSLVLVQSRDSVNLALWSQKVCHPPSFAVSWVSISPNWARLSDTRLYLRKPRRPEQRPLITWYTRTLLSRHRCRGNRTRRILRPLSWLDSEKLNLGTGVHEWQKTLKTEDSGDGMLLKKGWPALALSRTVSDPSRMHAHSSFTVVRGISSERRWV